jgi:DNA-binding transcriptional LysR family regulator
MRSIPIDVLRAFVAVVDQRGFTRAAEDLGRSQPTISLQVKRLEELIETPLFEKASRLTLTRSGEICLEYGRKILAQHDEMLDRLERERAVGDVVRLGMPSEFVDYLVPRLANLTDRDGQGLNFEFVCEMSEALLDRLRANQLDVALALTDEKGGEDAVTRWRMPMGWMASPGYRLPPNGPVPLITPPDGSLGHRIAVAAVLAAGRKFEIVCKSANHDVLRRAVDAGYGVCAAVTGLAPDGARVLPSSQIIALPDVTLGLFISAGSSPSPALIDRIRELLGSSPALAAA